MEENEIFISVIAGVLLMLFLVIVFIMSIVRYNKKAFLHFQEKLNMQSKFQETLLETQLEIQEQTLKNISLEIHDNIGQILSLIKLNLNTMNTNESTNLQDKIDGSKKLISKAINDLRDLSKSLNTDYVTEQGLVNSVNYELEMIKKTGLYETVFQIKGESFRLKGQQELIIFRIIQEALHNILRHSKATLINVHFIYEPGVFALNIIDNGSGFDTSQMEAKNYNGLGFGIRNMYNRAKIINAHFKLKSTKEVGTSIHLNIPINDQLN